MTNPQIISRATTFVLLWLIAGPVAAQDNTDKAPDPSDPTAIARYVTFTPFVRELSGEGQNEGEVRGIEVEPWFPLGQNNQLLSFTLTLQEARFHGRSTESGIGDTRIRYFYLFSGKPNSVLRAWAPSIDVFAPTGDEDKGLGTGEWIVAPNIVLAFKPHPKLDIYPFFRYIWSQDTVQVDNGSGDINLPCDEDTGSCRVDVSALNIEATFNWSFENLPVQYAYLAPNWTRNFDDDGESLQWKLGLGSMINQRVGFAGELRFDGGGENPTDDEVRFTAFYYF
ncbi:MAG: transporter [Acidiferrobacterales bacterium]|nr:transporter [Acidiferrobacterales bacterium]